MTGKLNLVVAHMAEARPLLAWFDLAEIEARGEFRHFGNSSGMALVVTGTGVERAAAGVRWLRERHPADAWLNLSIAGHPSAAVGAGRLIHAIRYRAGGERFWPPILDLGLPSCELITVDEPETAYPEDAAYDMEAAGFYAAAVGPSPADLVYVFKIVSDNREHPLREFDPSQVPALFEKQRTAIRKLSDHLRGRAAAYANWCQLPPEYEALRRKYRFSTTRKASFARLCRRFRALGQQPRLAELARSRYRDAAALMTALESALAQSPQADSESVASETGMPDWRKQRIRPLQASPESVGAPRPPVGPFAAGLEQSGDRPARSLNGPTPKREAEK